VQCLVRSGLAWKFALIRLFAVARPVTEAMGDTGVHITVACKGVAIASDAKERNCFEKRHCSWLLLGLSSDSLSLARLTLLSWIARAFHLWDRRAAGLLRWHGISPKCHLRGRSKDWGLLGVLVMRGNAWTEKLRFRLRPLLCCHARLFGAPAPLSAGAREQVCDRAGERRSAVP